MNVKKDRRLPIKGHVTKKNGDLVKADDVVAKTDLPGNVSMVKIANVLNIAPSDIEDVLLVKEGDSVIKGDMSLVGPRPALFNQKDLKN